MQRRQSSAVSHPVGPPAWPAFLHASSVGAPSAGATPPRGLPPTAGLLWGLGSPLLTGGHPLPAAHASLGCLGCFSRLAACKCGTVNWCVDWAKVLPRFIAPCLLARGPLASPLVAALAASLHLLLAHCCQAAHPCAACAGQCAAVERVWPPAASQLPTSLLGAGKLAAGRQAADRTPSSPSSPTMCGSASAMAAPPASTRSSAAAARAQHANLAAPAHCLQLQRHGCNPLQRAKRMDGLGASGVLPVRAERTADFVLDCV